MSDKYFRNTVKEGVVYVESYSQFGQIIYRGDHKDLTPHGFGVKFYETKEGEVPEYSKSELKTGQKQLKNFLILNLLKKKKFPLSSDL